MMCPAAQLTTLTRTNNRIIRNVSTITTTTLSSHADDDNISESENNFTYTTLDDDSIDSSSSSFTTSRNLQHTLHIIEYAAYTAGQIALNTAGQIAIKSTKANLRDLVTESDVKCQQLIRDIIRKEFPNDLFLGEEDVDLSLDSSVGASRDALEKVLLSGS